jgi:hypothetical protein
LPAAFCARDIRVVNPLRCGLSPVIAGDKAAFAWLTTRISPDAEGATGGSEGF